MLLDFVIRISVAALLGGIIGLDREYHAKDAGSRTHFLVAMGSALFMVISQFGFDSVLGLWSPEIVSFDPSRIGAQVVTGIGFIGAGTIIFQKHVVKGLTTAAGLWVTSAIGLACGVGMYSIAVVSTALVLLCFEAFNFLRKRIGSRDFIISYSADTEMGIKRALAKLKEAGIAIQSYKMETKHTTSGDIKTATMEIKVKRDRKEADITQLMKLLDGVTIESIE